jgi:hypothetical protein
MQQFKPAWLAVGRGIRWTFGFCVSVRCLRNGLRRQRFAQRRMDDSSFAFTARAT